jgi:LPXTG-site transpeptidase (sortase) family protein
LKTKKTKIIRYLGIVLIIGGILILAYPFYTNFVMRRQESQVLDAWASQVSAVPGETSQSGQSNTGDSSISGNQDTNGNTAGTSSDNSQSQDTTVAGPVTTLSPELFILDPNKKIPFKILIPKIGVEWIVHEGTDTASLKRGPGHYTGTALPGESSLCVIAGHRTTYGAPFNRVDKLEVGDEIILQSANSESFTYTVTGKAEVKPDDVSLLTPTNYGSLALTTCTPKFYATRRLIIFANYKG